MKKITLLVLFGGIVLLSFAQQKNQIYLDYIRQYRAMAVEQQTLYHIPASITMAQGLLESGAGRSELAVKANNHFGIKCSSDWQGASYTHDDEQKNECFRKYDDPSSSYNDHSIFLLKKRYEPLFALDISDYKGWANGLSKCGYATDPNYPEKLIALIELYRLDALTSDQPAQMHVIEDTANRVIYPADTMDIPISQSFREAAAMESVSMYYSHKSGHQNGVRYIVAREGESFSSLAYFLNMHEKTLRRYNDALDGRDLSAGDRVYLYLKHRRADRKHALYYVRKGDTAWSIAQQFGLRMKTIYELNEIPQGTPLVTRQELYLR